jgi:hypothetical protein
MSCQTIFFGLQGVGEGYWPVSFERVYEKGKNVKEKGKRRKI